MSKLRGHTIELRDGVWVFCDTGEPTVGAWQARPCGQCGQPSTAEGHDACLGALPGVMNACCGHGDVVDAYVQFLDGERLQGIEAACFFEGVLGGADTAIRAIKGGGA